MTLPALMALALFMATTLVLATFVLALSGHFPASDRLPALRGAIGTLVVWGTAAMAFAAFVLIVAFAARHLPWPAAVIGGGVTVLLAPIVLSLFSDAVVDGRSGLAGLATVALALSAAARLLPL